MNYILVNNNAINYFPNIEIAMIIYFSLTVANGSGEVIFKVELFYADDY
jgi:hypothetical protein